MQAARAAAGLISFVSRLSAITVTCGPEPRLQNLLFRTFCLSFGCCLRKVNPVFVSLSMATNRSSRSRRLKKNVEVSFFYEKLQTPTQAKSSITTNPTTLPETATLFHFVALVLLRQNHAPCLHSTDLASHGAVRADPEWECKSSMASCPMLGTGHPLLPAQG